MIDEQNCRPFNFMWTATNTEHFISNCSQGLNSSIGHELTLAFGIDHAHVVDRSSCYDESPQEAEVGQIAVCGTRVGYPR